VTSSPVGGSRARRVVGAALVGLMTLSLTVWMTACVANPSDKEKEGDGVGITGIDHLANHLSVQNFWVNGYNAAQAGKGGRTVCCVIVPRKWQPGTKVHIKWNVTNWRERTSQSYESDVELDRYEEVGKLYVHFLANGQVRALLTNYYPEGNAYPGPRDPIPSKHPWDDFPWPSEKK
jgi:hypothetical protein